MRQQSDPPANHAGALPDVVPGNHRAVLERRSGDHCYYVVVRLVAGE